jgi:hypothetical protein
MNIIILDQENQSWAEDHPTSKNIVVLKCLAV